LATIKITDLDLASFIALERLPDDDEAVIDILLLLFVLDESYDGLVDEIQNSFQGGNNVSGGGSWRNEVPLDSYLVGRLEWIREIVSAEVNLTSGDAFKFGAVRIEDLISFSNSMIQSSAVRSWIAQQLGNLLARTSCPVPQRISDLLEQLSQLFSLPEL